MKKENLVKELKEHITMLLEFDRFEMASFYCDIATRIFYDKPIDISFLKYMNKNIEIDMHIVEYLKKGE